LGWVDDGERGVSGAGKERRGERESRDDVEEHEGQEREDRSDKEMQRSITERHGHPIFH
jgi:hypothetical protein